MAAEHFRGSMTSYINTALDRYLGGVPDPSGIKGSKKGANGGEQRL